MSIKALLAAANPWSDDFYVPDIKGHKNIIRYMLAEQVRLYGKNFDQPYNILTRNFKLLCSEYSDQEVMWGVCCALVVCDHPFSTAKIKELICQSRPPESDESSPNKF